MIITKVWNINKQSQDRSNDLNIAMGCPPSLMFCKQAKPEVPAYISNCIPYARGCITISSFIFIGKFNDIWLFVIPMFSELVYV